MASAISSGEALEDFSGQNQDAASFNRFAAVFVYCVYGGSLSAASDAAADAPSFYGFLCTAHGTVWSVPRSQNADIDMDQRDCAHQTGRSGHDYFIRRFRIHGIAVRRIYAPARMDIGLLQVYELLCGGKSVSMRVCIHMAAKKGGCPFFGFVTETL